MVPRITNSLARDALNVLQYFAFLRAFQRGGKFNSNVTSTL